MNTPATDAEHYGACTLRLRECPRCLRFWGAPHTADRVAEANLEDLIARGRRVDFDNLTEAIKLAAVAQEARAEAAQYATIANGMRRADVVDAGYLLERLEGFPGTQRCGCDACSELRKFGLPRVRRAATMATRNA